MCEPDDGSIDRRIRAAWRLGFFVLPALIGCMPVSPYALAAGSDEGNHTRAFTWLVDHAPSALVVWGIPVAPVRQVIPATRVEPARGKPCVQAKRLHAELLLVARVTAAANRDAAEDCGFALFRDGGAIVVAPR